jgi:hypothetical protein
LAFGTGAFIASAVRRAFIATTVKSGTRSSRANRGAGEPVS